MNGSSVQRAVDTIKRGGIVCHACEGVWGFACDPIREASVRRVLEIKGRTPEKGLILIGHDSSVFEAELKQLTPVQNHRVVSSWPGHTTWLVPNVRFPEWITGSFKTVAIRVPEHLQARRVAQEFGGPLVSTSANVSGTAPMKNESLVRATFEDTVDFVLSGKVGNAIGPSTIRDALSGDVLR